MMLRKYETLFITKPDLPDEAMEKVKQRVTGALKKHGGIEIAYQDWGKRKMAYQIQKLAKGNYVYVRYLGTGTTVSEIEHQMKVLDDVMRFVTVKLGDRIVAETFDIEADKATIYPFGARPRDNDMRDDGPEMGEPGGNAEGDSKDDMDADTEN